MVPSANVAVTPNGICCPIYANVMFIGVAFKVDKEPVACSTEINTGEENIALVGLLIPTAVKASGPVSPPPGCDEGKT